MSRKKLSTQNGKKKPTEKIAHIENETLFSAQVTDPDGQPGRQPGPGSRRHPA